MKVRIIGLEYYTTNRNSVYLELMYGYNISHKLEKYAKCFRDNNDVRLSSIDILDAATFHHMFRFAQHERIQVFFGIE
jgi:hypothetical protein